jgi:hypothetical protein
MHGKQRKVKRATDPVTYALARLQSKSVVQAKNKRAVVRQQLKEALSWQ